MSKGGGEGGAEGRLREGADGVPGGDVNFWWSQPPWLAFPPECSIVQVQVGERRSVGPCSI